VNTEYWSVFITGCASTIILGGLVYVIVLSNRHLCKHCMVKNVRNRTKKECRIFILPVRENTPNDMTWVRVYIFRTCSKGCVTCDVKEELITNLKLRKMPWSNRILDDSFSKALFKKAGIKIPEPIPLSIVNHSHRVSVRIF
jgi:hypothetical protein